jgi:uncharacterized integral membrane protein
MSTEPQPIPTSASAPLPRPTIGDQVLSPAPADQPGPVGQPPSGSAPPASSTPSRATQHKIKRTRISGLWVAVGFFAVILLLLLIFILQNSKTVDVSYMGAHGHLPLGVALLLSAVCGVLLVVLAGGARISQLRTVARRHRRADAQSAKAANNPAS